VLRLPRASRPGLLLALCPGVFALTPACGTNGAGPSGHEAEAGTVDGSDDGSADASDDWLAPPPNLTCSPESTVAPLRQACTFAAGAWPEQTIGCEYPVGANIPINHVIVIMQENRSFDHYLGRLVAQGYYNGGDFTVVPDGGVGASDAGAPGSPGSGFSHSDEVDVPPPGWSNPDSDGGLVYPQPDTEHCYGVNHDWGTMHTAWDNGKNDGFVIANNPDGKRTFYYEDDTVIPFYYALANTFSIGDRYFCSVLSETWPNRYYMMAATSFGVTGDIWQSQVSSNALQIFTLLEEAGHTWKDYTDGSHMEYLFLAFAGLQPQPCDGPVSTGGCTFGNVRCNLFGDIKNNTLPDVAFMDGSELTTQDTDASDPYENQYSDEGPPDLPQIGGQVVESVIRALWASDAWKDTAVFITRDENGGIADHVPPAAACEPDGHGPVDQEGNPLPGAFNTTGFRVPFIVVSPYARQHYVSHVVYDHTSILRFIEARFGLPAMTARDANATPPMDMFDFQNPPFMTPPTITATTTVPPALLAQCSQSLPLTCSP
jgi:phospholipase C